ncbi:hypothetical protein Mic7113_6576 (plasmid) [Allocoleopsis franciscana PCC 7113]|uniref:Uncharacterized protein n=1 Tax=Allocoleopsis franciscana PCC 7113 TaxID=1173027 RepID=K9WQV0_9CYAN|nr:hypothetical protein Mic7113_6576 [Allocoleopsis franciscana PCC 7113]
MATPVDVVKRTFDQIERSHRPLFALELAQAVPMWS